MSWFMGVGICKKFKSGMKQLLLLIILFALSFFSKNNFAAETLNTSILNEYLKLQKEFSQKNCRPGTEESFLELDRKYRGDGNFIPVLLDDKIDQKTITNLLPLIREKSNWIQAQIEFVKNIENVKELRFQIDRIVNELSLLQEAQKEYFFAKEKIKKEEIKTKAARQFAQLQKEVESLKEQVPFLLSFKFPLNHLSLRADYEKYKNINTKEGRGRANSIYLFRKITEDGAYDEDLVHSDAAIRATFDTLYLSLTKDQNRDFLNDNERVDFNYILKSFSKFLSFKSDTLVARLAEWKGRTDRSIAFYQSLLEGKKVKFTDTHQIKDVTSLLEERDRSLYTLKDFVLSRESRVYEYWSRRSDLFQALFAIETILYSEVGRMDAPDLLERRDVTQIILNRAEDPRYNMLSSRDSITKYISSKVKISENKWLNVLFKEGEFSFTYFYIPGNFHIYCPDMSKTGQFLRRENVRIALELLNKPRKNFKALRYFSRLGMFGRIEMDSLWSDFRALPEKPGKMVRNPKKLYELFKKDRYKFLYSFNNQDLKKDYIVVDIKGKTYVVDANDNKLIYYYRNPHLFKYFIH